MKKIIIAPDKFKETFTSQEIALLIKEELSKRYDYDFQILPIADGGDGSIAAIHNSCSSKIINKEVTGPNFEKITAEILLLNEKEAVIECSNVVGYKYKHQDSYTKNTTSLGLGELIKECIAKNLKKVYVCLGGTITSDGGCGLLSGLGVRFYNNEGEFIPTGKNLIDIKNINIDNFNCNIDIELLSDVDNPLYGPNGASYIYAKQKGATDSDVSLIDKGLQNLNKIVTKLLGKDYSNCSGSGAAGGIGYGLISFCNAKKSSGIEKILDIIDFDDKVKGASLVITGEGKIDYQSACGKAISGIIKRSHKYGVDVIAIVGLMDGEQIEFQKLGLKAVYPSLDKPKPIEEVKKTCVDDMRQLLQKITIE